MTARSKSLGIIVIAAVLTLTSAGYARAFCIHNESDIVMEVKEVAGGSFFGGYSAGLNSGSTGCCNWQDSGCNTKGNNYNIVNFDVWYELTGSQGYFTTSVCSGFGIRADGDLYVRGSNGQYGCY